MKRILFSFFLAGFVSISFAQNSAIDNAVLYHKDGTLDQAKKEIDQAVAHEKTKASPKAWYYKGVIYADLYKSGNPSYKSLSPTPLKDATEALQKAEELDASQGQWYQLADNKLKELWAEVINKGIGEYENESLKDAQASFELAQQIMPQDTSAYIYGAYAAEALGDLAALKKYMDALLNLNYKSVYVYRTLISLEKNPAKKIELAKSASADFPQEEVLRETLGDAYYEAGNYQDALNTYSILQGMMPTNTAIMTKRALQYQKLNDMDKAAELYEKIASLDPSNFIAHYNVAVIYYEKAKAQDIAVHKLSMDEYHKKGKQMEEEINALFEKAKSHATTALSLTKDEADINNIKIMLSEIEKKLKK